MTEPALPATSDRASVIAELERSTIVRSERIAGTSRNVLQRIELADGRVLGVKHYARGRDYATEGAALRELAGLVPVPEIVSTLDRVIAYRWIDGMTLHALAQRDPGAVIELAAPLGALLGRLARIPREPAVTVAPALDRLAAGQARAQLGARVADALADRLAATRFDEPACFVHGTLDAHAVLVTPEREIAGVLDWETFGTGSRLSDAASLVRAVGHHDDAPAAQQFRAELARGHGALPDDWWPRARLLDTLALMAQLDAPGANTDALRAAITAALA